MKKYPFPFMALTIAAGISPFTAPHALKQGLTDYYYIFNGLQTLAGRETLSNYTLSSTPTTDPGYAGGPNEGAVAMSFFVGTEPGSLSYAQRLTFDGSGFPNGTFPGGTGIFVKNEKKP